ncbi:MAG TPA: dTDP-4-dehydrorhamnose 3,5-epimerase [Thermoanaerobaculia bacterium]|jgi:dTDP-4-dehydrorhamnose 3,5-epimerase|nr:dTDP-4-dehydrorhamnose 3,5-epimerase [Thermoanaerobaculia bacterium]
MKFTPTEIPEVILVEPDVFPDSRGFFFEAYHAEKFAANGIVEAFVQDNQSHSIRGTLRGLHAQRLQPQGKLVRTLIGEIFDVAVDIRPGSETFGRWVGATLSAENRLQLWVPPGFAHGFLVLSETADVLYKCTTLYRRDDEIGILWNDPEIGIEWPLDGDPLLSPKDAVAPRLAEIRDRLV